MAFKVKKESSKRFKENSFTLSNYYDIARKEGMNVHDSIVFSEFMRRRFPNERDSVYVGEWVTRFKSGNPEVYMDADSLKEYKKAKEGL